MDGGGDRGFGGWGPRGDITHHLLRTLPIFRNDRRQPQRSSPSSAESRGIVYQCKRRKRKPGCQIKRKDLAGAPLTRFLPLETWDTASTLSLSLSVSSLLTPLVRQKRPFLYYLLLHSSVASKVASAFLLVLRTCKSSPSSSHMPRVPRTKRSAPKGLHYFSGESQRKKERSGESTLRLRRR